MRKNIFLLGFLPEKLQGLPFFLTLVLIFLQNISFKKSQNYLTQIIKRNVLNFEKEYGILNIVKIAFARRWHDESEFPKNELS